MAFPLCAAFMACGTSANPAADDHSAGTSGSAGETSVGGAAGTSMSASAGRPMNANGGRGAQGGAGTAGAGLANGGATLGAAGSSAGGQQALSGGAGADFTSGQGGTSGLAGAPDRGVPVEGVPGIGAFTSFTLRFLSGAPEGGGYCGAEPDQNVLTYDRATRTLVYEFCNGHQPANPVAPLQGRMTLTDAEVQGLLNALSEVKTGPTPGCFSDTTPTELDVDVGGTTTVYTEDYCPTDPNEKLINGVDTLVRWLEWLASHTLPPKPSKFKLSTGVAVPAKPNACVTTPYPLDYELDLATGKLTWSWCEIDPSTDEHLDPWPSDSATLDTTKLAAVLQAYAALTIGVSGPCSSIPAPPYVGTQGGRPASLIVDDSVDLADEAAACYGYANADGWTIGVAALTHLIVDDLPQ